WTGSAPSASASRRASWGGRSATAALTGRRRRYAVERVAAPAALGDRAGGVGTGMEAAVRIELTNTGFADPRLTTWLRRRQVNDASRSSAGAGNGIRTRDPDLGKVVLYH